MAKKLLLIIAGIALLLVGAVADCFILSFRAIARKARLEWTSLTAESTGEHDKIDKLRGLNISFTTSATNDAEGRALLAAFNFPFKN